MLFKNAATDPNAYLTSSNVFITENFKVNDTFGIKNFSTEEKYNSPFSNIKQIAKIRHTEDGLEFFCT